MEIKAEGLKNLLGSVNAKKMGAHALVGGGIGLAGTAGYNAYTGQDHSMMGGALLGAIGGAGAGPARRAMRGTANGTDVQVAVTQHGQMPTERQLAESFDTLTGRRGDSLTALQRQNIASEDARYAKQQNRIIRGTSTLGSSGESPVAAPFWSKSAEKASKDVSTRNRIRTAGINRASDDLYVATAEDAALNSGRQGIDDRVRPLPATPRGTSTAEKDAMRDKISLQGRQRLAGRPAIVGDPSTIEQRFLGRPGRAPRD
jgi:hypothetical protein